MNLLIIGGLFIFGVLAIIGVVLLGMSEQRDSAGARSRRPAPPESNEQAPRNTSNEPIIARPNLLAAGATTRSTIQEQSLPALNVQYQELAEELSTLHEQAWQLEQRINVLTEMVNRLEQFHSERENFDEDSLNSSDNTLVGQPAIKLPK